MLFPIRLMILQSTEITGAVLTVQGRITFLSHTILPPGKKIPGFIHIKQIIIFFIDNIYSVCRLIYHALKQARIRRHAGKNRIKTGIFRQRPHPAPVEVYPDQLSVLMAHTIGNIQNLSALQRIHSRFPHTFPVLLINDIKDIIPGHFFIFFAGMSGKRRNTIGKISGNKILPFHTVAGYSAGYGVNQMIHFQLGFLQIGNVMKYAVKHRIPVFFTNPLDLNTYPYDIGILMPAAEFETVNFMRPDNLPRPGSHHFHIFPIDHRRSIPLN